MSWLTEYIFDETGYRQVLTHMNHIAADEKTEAISQIVPANDDVRKKFIESMNGGSQRTILDVNVPLGNDLQSVTKWKTNVISQNNNKMTRTICPIGLLLAGSMRWSMGFTYDYWVPYLVMVHSRDVQEMEEMLNSTDSQYKQSSHFRWTKSETPVTYLNQQYTIYQVAAHWTHKAAVADNVTSYNLMDFTQVSAVGDVEKQTLDWTQHNVTSHELLIKDNGQENTSFAHVYCASYEEQLKVKPGYILASDGRFYKSENEMGRKVSPLAVVVYYNTDETAVEQYTDYHGLAIAVNDLSVMDTDAFLFDDNRNQDDLDWGQCTHAYIPNDLSLALNGLTVTERLARGCEDDHVHPAFKYAYTPIATDDVLSKSLYKFSNWFVPSTGQWILALKCQDVVWNAANATLEVPEGVLGNNWKYLKQEWVLNHFDDNAYWTSTGVKEEDEDFGDNYDKAYSFKATGEFLKEYKSERNMIRRMVAFKIKK